MRFSKLFTAVLFSFFIIGYLACKKTDSIQNKPLQPTDKFFTVSMDAPKEIKAIAEALQKQNDKYNYLSSITKKAGYPRWDKVRIVNFDNRTVTERGNDAESGEIVYIPFVRDSENYVNSLLAVKMDPSDTVYRMVHDYNYRKFGYDTTDPSKWNARDVFNLFASFDNSVFGHTRFIIEDGEIFGRDTTSGFVAELVPHSTIRAGKEYLMEPITACQDYMVCGTCSASRTSIVFCCNPSPYTVCTTYWIETGGGGGTTGTGDGTGGTTGGGGSGGTGWYDGSDPCTGSTSPTPTPRLSTVAPVDGCGSGWTPVQPVDDIAFADPQEFNFYSDPNIDLEQLFNCFNNVPDNGATYTIKLCADVPVNSRPGQLVDGNLSPGHSFITITKTNGSSSVTQSFGFYPVNGVKSINMQPQDSKMNNNGGHEYDASIEVTMTATQFSAVHFKAKDLTPKQYDLNNFNCTDYAIEVFNVVKSGDPIIVQDWHGAGTDYNYGTTPNGLYYRLKEMSPYNTNVEMGTKNAPAGSGLCP